MPMKFYRRQFSPNMLTQLDACHNQQLLIFIGNVL